MITKIHQSNNQNRFYFFLLLFLFFLVKVFMPFFTLYNLWSVQWTGDCKHIICLFFPVSTLAWFTNSLYWNTLTIRWLNLISKQTHNRQSLPIGIICDARNTCAVCSVAVLWSDNKVRALLLLRFQNLWQWLCNLGRYACCWYVHHFFTCRVSVHWRCHDLPRLNEFSGVVSSCFPLSRRTSWTEVLFSWTGRLAQTVSQGNRFFKVLGQE